MFTQTFFSTKRECWKEDQSEVILSCEGIPTHSLCAIMVIKDGTVAAVLNYVLLTCLQLVHPTAATKWASSLIAYGSNFLSVDSSMEKILPWYFSLSGYFNLHYDNTAKKASHQTA